MRREHDDLAARLRAADQQFGARGPTAADLVAGVHQLEQRRIRQRWQRRTTVGVVAALAIAAWCLSLVQRERSQPSLGPASEVAQMPALPAARPPLPPEALPPDPLAAIHQSQTEIAAQLARVRLQQLTWRYQDLSHQLLALDQQRQIALQRADLRQPLQVDPAIDFGF